MLPSEHVHVKVHLLYLGLELDLPPSTILKSSIQGIILTLKLLQLVHSGLEGFFIELFVLLVCILIVLLHTAHFVSHTVKVCTFIVVLMLPLLKRMLLLLLLDTYPIYTLIGVVFLSVFSLSLQNLILVGDPWGHIIDPSNDLFTIAD